MGFCIWRNGEPNTAEGTIKRECAVLMAVINLAVVCEALEKSRLRRLPFHNVSSGKMVPRDRIELSTPAFSGLTENKYFQ